MKDKAIFLDRDGTINEDKGYVYRIQDLKIIPKVIEGLKLFKYAEYKLIIVTNQSGIGRGYYTEEDYFEFREEMHKQLIEEGIKIDAEYFCPHKSDDECNCRKPKTGMLEQAAKDFNLNLEKCCIIGDHLSDIQTGKNAGCKTIHILTGHIQRPISYADFIAKNMIEAANYVLNNI